MTRTVDPLQSNRGPRVNDLALKIGTVNGTGSASANGLLRRAIFRMGIPVSGKNLFPSNIQGLPTWYEIRVNSQGHTARTRVFDLAVAMNPATYVRDIQEVRPGGWVVHDSSWPLSAELQRDELTFIGVPMADSIPIVDGRIGDDGTAAGGAASAVLRVFA